MATDSTAGRTVGRYDVPSHVPPGSSDPDASTDDLDAMGSVDALGSQPLVRVQWPEIAELPRRRSVLPALALLGSAAAVLAAALVVVANRPPRRTTAVGLPALVADSAIESDRERAVRERPSEPYGAAIRHREHELRRCAQDHGGAFPVDAEAVIAVGVDGRTLRVALRPDSAEHSPLGSCIRGVLQDVAFPPASSDMEVAVGLAVYR
jgi:hypothetical protein